MLELTGNRNVLIITNLLYGVTRTFCTISCEKPYYYINNIIKNSSRFSRAFIINDKHNKDDKEFELMPEHCLSGSIDCQRLDYIEKQIKCPIEILTKKGFSGLSNVHNTSVICNSGDRFFLAGFTLSLDITQTAIDLLKNGKDSSIILDCCGDLNKDFREKGIENIKKIGINLL
jgi:nicotinamidase-related amidase